MMTLSLIPTTQVTLVPETILAAMWMCRIRMQITTHMKAKADIKMIKLTANIPKVPSTRSTNTIRT
jgi:hypothetical protein